MPNEARSLALLREAAAALEQGSDPFASAWLEERHVSLSECLELANGMATIVQAYLAAPPERRASLLVYLLGDDVPPEIKQGMLEILDLRSLQRSQK